MTFLCYQVDDSLNQKHTSSKLFLPLLFTREAFLYIFNCTIYYYKHIHCVVTETGNNINCSSNFFMQHDFKFRSFSLLTSTFGCFSSSHSMVKSDQILKIILFIFWGVQIKQSILSILLLIEYMTVDWLTIRTTSDEEISNIYFSHRFFSQKTFWRVTVRKAQI